MKNLIIKTGKFLLGTNTARQSELIRNVYHRQYNKKVLISYITSPFTEELHDKHTNVLECYTACQIFDELKFIVDVIDYNAFDKEIVYSEYDVIYGFGESLERFFYSDSFKIDNKIRTIVYGTGCDTVYSNKVSLSRVYEFLKKESILCLSSARVVNNTWRCQIVFSDLIIALGNQFVANTYKLYNKHRVQQLNLFYKDSGSIDLKNKDFKRSKNNFIWWGSAGAIHKGLDLVIDLFSRRKDLVLYICGYHVEEPFNSYLESKLIDNDNIKNVGFIKIGSSKYKELLNVSIATILPSVSEGGAPGVINNCSFAGLIPIVSKNCGLDVPDATKQFVLKEVSINNLELAVDKILLLSEKELEKISFNVLSFFRAKYSFDEYKSNLKRLIQSAFV